MYATVAGACAQNARGRPDARRSNNVAADDLRCSKGQCSAAPGQRVRTPSPRCSPSAHARQRWRAATMFSMACQAAGRRALPWQSPEIDRQTGHNKEGLEELLPRVQPAHRMTKSPTDLVYRTGPGGGGGRWRGAEWKTYLLPD